MEIFLMFVLLIVAVAISYKRGELAGRFQGLMAGQLIGEAALDMEAEEQELREQMNRGEISQMEYDDEIAKLLVQRLKKIKQNQEPEDNF